MFYSRLYAVHSEGRTGPRATSITFESQNDKLLFKEFLMEFTKKEKNNPKIWAKTKRDQLHFCLFCFFYLVLVKLSSMGTNKESLSCFSVLKRGEKYAFI